MEALLFINHGRPVVECPYGCMTAYLYEPGKFRRVCDGAGGCGGVFSIIVPSNLPELMYELSKRPNMINRNWYPVGHPHEEKHNVPVGQTIADLAAEFAYESAREAEEGNQ